MTMGNRINKLEKRLREAQARRDYATVAKLMQEIEQARQAEEAEERISLYEEGKLRWWYLEGKEEVVGNVHDNPELLKGDKA